MSKFENFEFRHENFMLGLFDPKKSTAGRNPDSYDFASFKILKPDSVEVKQNKVLRISKILKLDSLTF